MSTSTKGQKTHARIGNRTPTDPCLQLFIEASLIGAETWKQPKYPSPNEWINNMWHIHTMEY